ncbi:MAG: hypothetical protein QW486_06360 [Candidatus Bathyarchaeia archaeon]
MLSRRCLGALVLLAMLTRLQPYPAVSQQTSYFNLLRVHWGEELPREVSPGDTGILSVFLRYEHLYTVRNLVAELSLPSGFIPVGGGSKAQAYYSGTVSTGSIVRLAFPITISREASLGAYPARLELDYYIDALSRWRREVLELYIEVTGKPRIEVRAQEVPLTEGSQLLNLTLINEGDGAAENVKVVEAYSSTASAELPGEVRLGRMEPGEVRPLGLSIYVPPELRSSLVPLILVVTCVGPRNTPYNFTRSLMLNLRPTASTPHLRLKVEPMELQAGESTMVNLTMTNTGKSRLSEVRVDLSPDATLKLFGEAHFYVEGLGPGETRLVRTEVYVPMATTSTAATLTAVLRYYDEGLRVSRSEEERLNLRVRAQIQTPSISYMVRPEELTAGRDTTLQVTVFNVRLNSLRDVRLELSSESPVKILGASIFQLGSLEHGGNSSITVRVYAPLTAPSTATLTLTSTFYDEGLRTVQSEAQRLNLLVKGVVSIPPISISVEPEELTIGKSGDLHLRVRASEGRGLNDIRIDLSPDATLKVFGESRFKIDHLGPGEEKTLKARVYVPATATAATTTLTVTATYLKEGSEVVESESWRLNMLLRGLIEISLTDMAVIPSNPRPGSAFSITLTVTNTGTSTAYAAYAVPSIQGLPLRAFGPRSVYIGNIDANLPTTFTVNLQMENTTVKAFELPIHLSYLDNLRTPYTITLTIPIQVGAQAATQTPQRSPGILEHPLFILGAAGLSAILVGILLLRRRRRT